MRFKLAVLVLLCAPIAAPALCFAEVGAVDTKYVAVGDYQQIPDLPVGARPVVSGQSIEVSYREESHAFWVTFIKTGPSDLQFQAASGQPLPHIKYHVLPRRRLKVLKAVQRLVENMPGLGVEVVYDPPRQGKDNWGSYTFIESHILVSIIHEGIDEAWRTITLQRAFADHVALDSKDTKGNFCSLFKCHHRKEVQVNFDDTKFDIVHDGAGQKELLQVMNDWMSENQKIRTVAENALMENAIQTVNKLDQIRAKLTMEDRKKSVKEYEEKIYRILVELAEALDQ